MGRCAGGPPERVAAATVTACPARGFRRAHPGLRFDLVIAKPPYVPSPNARLPTCGPQRAWDGGTDGRRVIDRICTTAPALLPPGGVLLLVHSGMCEAETTVRLLALLGLPAGSTTWAWVPWGPVLRSRGARLRERGPVDEGDELEELVIIRAQCL